MGRGPPKTRPSSSHAFCVSSAPLRPPWAASRGLSRQWQATHGLHMRGSTGGRRRGQRGARRGRRRVYVGRRLCGAESTLLPHTHAASAAERVGVPMVATRERSGEGRYVPGREERRGLSEDAKSCVLASELIFVFPPRVVCLPSARVVTPNRPIAIHQEPRGAGLLFL